MINDNQTGDPIGCPICQSTDSRSHLLAVMDRSFGTCDGGAVFDRFPRFGSLIQSALHQALTQEGSKRLRFASTELENLWDQVRGSDAQVVDIIQLGDDVLIRLAIDLLVEAGGQEPVADAVDDSGPGRCSALTLLYAEKPDQLIDQALSLLEQQLKVALDGTA